MSTINVLVVDDSKVARLLLAHILETDPDIHVTGSVGDGQSAVEFAHRHQPHVILMDIQMPGMDGFEATRRIMETHPIPIVACTAAANPSEVATTFRVMEAGALACVEKPVAPDHPEFERQAAILRDTVKLMSEVRVVRRWSRARLAAVPRPATRQPGIGRSPARVTVVGIGASTGGPQVLQEILSGLPKAFPVPLLIVQHIAAGFLPGLADWLNQTTGLRVQIGAYGVEPLPGHVYLAPDNFHMGVTNHGRIVLTREEPENHLRPAVSYLFRSLAHACGPSAIGVLLTGMGKDGAAELKLMRDKGAITIAQDGASSAVHGMPGEAIRLDGASHVLPSNQIAAALDALVHKTQVREPS